MPVSRILRSDELDSVLPFWDADDDPLPHVPPASIDGPGQQRPPETIEQLEKVREAAYEEGRLEGERLVQPEKERYDSFNAELASTIQELAGLKESLRRDAVEDMIRLALGVAERVLHRQVHVDAEALRGIVQAAIERINRQDLTRVRTHPMHIADLKRALAELSASSPVEVTADPALSPGSVIFETTRGELDGSVETQLSEIRRGLADFLRRGT